ncbi:MAG: insulinase family protein [Nitratireductor sp.]|nr:insulinase family protein [Nitratireductor sp.]
MRRIASKGALLIALCSFLVAPVATTANASETKGPGVSSRQLGNGLEVVVIPDRRAPVVTHMIWYKVGAADEMPGKSGIAHFLEHLMFKGTKITPAGEFSAKVAEIGGQENAFTTADNTAYYQKVSPQALRMVMQYEADRMENLVLTENDIVTERDVILEERRQRVDSNPSAILSEAADAALYDNHPYGIPVIGWEQEMAKLSLADAIEFYDRWYTPNNAVLVVAGDVDAEEVFAMADEIYGKVERRAEPGKRVRPAEPDHLTPATVSYSDKRVSEPTMRRTYLVAAYSSGKAGDGEALEILSALLGGMQTSRITTALTVDDPIASRAGSWYNSNRDYGEFGVYVAPRPGEDLTIAEKRLDVIIDDLLEKGVTAEEVDLARNSIIKSAFFSRDSQTAMARLYGSVLSTDGIIEDVTRGPDRFREITVEDVNRVARKWLDRRRSVTALLLPETGNGSAMQ